MNNLREIVQLGNPILREKAKPVTNVHLDSIQALIDELMATLKPSNGVGIAAPQIGESYRIFILASRPTREHPDFVNREKYDIIQNFFRLFPYYRIAKVSDSLTKPAYQDI